jgi:hypothetical protein
MNRREMMKAGVAVPLAAMGGAALADVVAGTTRPLCRTIRRWWTVWSPEGNKVRVEANKPLPSGHYFTQRHRVGAVRWETNCPPGVLPSVTITTTTTRNGKEVPFDLKFKGLPSSKAVAAQIQHWRWQAVGARRQGHLEDEEYEMLINIKNPLEP